jgi:hypothetical protein
MLRRLKRLGKYVFNYPLNCPEIILRLGAITLSTIIGATLELHHFDMKIAFLCSLCGFVPFLFILCIRWHKEDTLGINNAKRKG